MNPEAEHWKTQRVYLRRGRVVHLIPAWASPNTLEPALCGVMPATWNAWHGAESSWHGTGSQDEYEQAEQMAICLSCQRAKRRGRVHD